MRKHEENYDKCASLHPSCCRVIWRLGSITLGYSFFARREGIMANTPTPKVLGDLFGRLSFILMQSNEEPFSLVWALSSNLNTQRHSLISNFMYLYSCLFHFCIFYMFLFHGGRMEAGGRGGGGRMEAAESNHAL